MGKLTGMFMVAGLAAGCSTDGGSNEMRFPAAGKASAGEHAGAAHASSSWDASGSLASSWGLDGAYGSGAAIVGADASGAILPPPSFSAESVRVQRKVVYTASLGLRVGNVRQTLAQVEEIVQRHEGFAKSSNLSSLTFRVKPKEFDAAIAEVEALGEVTARDVSSNDVTDQYVDIEMRIETAESSRQRLLKLLEEVKDTKAVIEVERDIRRLTEEIETMKGRLRALGDQADWATITVRLEPRTSEAAQRRSTSSPFPWIRTVGIERSLVMPRGYASKPSLRSRVFGPAFDLNPGDGRFPAGFIPLEDKWGSVLAATPEDARLRAWRLETQTAAGIDDWTKAVAAELERNRGYDLGDMTTLGMGRRELIGRGLSGEVVHEGETWRYDLWIVAHGSGGHELLLVECVRPKSDEEDATVSVAKAVEGVRW